MKGLAKTFDSWSCFTGLWRMCDSPLFDNQCVHVIVLKTSAFDGLLNSFYRWFNSELGKIEWCIYWDSLLEIWRKWWQETGFDITFSLTLGKYIERKSDTDETSVAQTNNNIIFIGLLICPSVSIPSEFCLGSLCGRQSQYVQEKKHETSPGSQPLSNTGKCIYSFGQFKAYMLTPHRKD